jgi:hypothetical protein
MARMTRKTVLLAKKESNYGQDASPVGSADGLLIEELEIEPIAELLQRNFYKDSFTKQAPVMGMAYNQISFKVELKGSGTAGTAPAIGKLLKACGMAEDVSAGTSVTYTPESDDDDVDSLTLYAYRDGVLHKMVGARGTFTMDLQAGKYGMLSFVFKGLYQTIVDDSNATLSNLETTLPAVIQGAAFTWGSYEAIASKLDIDFGANVVPAESFNASFGIYAFRISDRNTQGSFNPDAVLEATHPFWADWKNNVQRALSITCGSEAGNICTITAGSCASTGVNYEDKEGVLAYNVPFLMTEESTDDDEIEIVFT